MGITIEQIDYLLRLHADFITLRLSNHAGYPRGTDLRRAIDAEDDFRDYYDRLAMARDT